MIVRRFTLLLSAALLVGACGPAAPKPAATYATIAEPAATRPSRGTYLLHLPGIAGPRWIDQNLLEGLKLGGVSAEFDCYDWTCGEPGIPALQAYERNRAEAKKIAERIASRYRADPSSPIELTSHSGGAGLLVWALESLPDDVMVDSVLMLAPALSPGYDLTKALRHVRKQVYVFISANDGIVLGSGTKMFGTIDRVHTDAAGRVGFTRPDGADAAQYAKLVTRPYDAAWNDKYHHNGDHIGVMSKRFAAGLLAPLLKTAGVAAAINTEANAPAQR